MQTVLSKPFAPAVLWLCVVTGLSVMPGVSLPDFNLFQMDKLGHAVCYGILTLTILYGFFRQNRSITSTELAMAVVAASAYGIFMEWVQGTFFPYRYFEYDDMIANILGAVLSIFVFRFIANR